MIDHPRKPTLFWHSLHTKLIIFWLAFTVLLGTTSYLIFEAAIETQFQELRQRLIAIATTGALQIDGEAHATIPAEPASVAEPAYQSLTGHLRAIRQANPEIRYVYTVTPSKRPGTWQYIGDADEQPSLPGDQFDVSQYPAMAAALAGPTADERITVDEWGPLLSGYAPIRNSHGQAVGLLGIDMSGQSVANIQSALHEWRLAVLIIGLAAMVCLGFMIVFLISRPIQQLLHGTQRIGDGDLTYRVPIQSKDEVGLLANAFNRMAQQLFYSLTQLQLHVLQTIEALSAAIEAKDRYTRGHSARVQHYAIKIAQRMGLPEAKVDLIRQYSALHDIGKIGVKEGILMKPDKLTPEEFEDIRRHPDLGYKILAPLKLPKEALDIVRHHHERIDGHGYPAGLLGDRIPLVVSIVSVADTFDAITARRPYRPTPMTFPEAVDELRKASGTQLHPEAVDALIDVLRKEGKLSTPAEA